MYSGVISIFSERIKKGLPITIYGDGQQTRDFVNVADVVHANLLAMGIQRSDVNGQRSDPSNPDQPTTDNYQPVSCGFAIFNVATGRQTSLLQLLDALEMSIGQAVERKFMPARDGDIRHSLADISKVRKVFGFEPRIDLQQGLLQLII